MARALAFLFAAGAALVGLTLVLPHADDTRELGVLVPVVLAIGVVAALLSLAGRASVGGLQAVLAGGTVLISECVLFGGDAAGAYALMYVWVALYAAYFFSRRAAAAQLALAAILYGVVLAVQDDTPVAHAYWLMGMGTVVVGAVLIAGLTDALRAQTADLATVAHMAGGLSDISEFGRATCEGLARSARADAVALLEPADGGEALAVTAAAGPVQAAAVLDGARARAAVQAAVRTAAPQAITTAAPRGGRDRARGTVLGLAQPILRDGRAVGVLALAWSAPRRTLPDRVRTAALLFATEASLALERAERLARDRERAALEINDNIVQGLVVAKYLASAGETEQAVGAIDETLAKARRLITDQLTDVGRPGGQILPGDLARSEASTVGPPPPED